MFNIQDFQDYPELSSFIKKINKYTEKDKKDKVASKVEELMEHLDKEELKAPITYIISVLIEDYPQIITQSHVNRIKDLIKSKNIKLKLNTILILGFFLIHHPKVKNKEYIFQFTDLLTNPNEDIRYNCYFFLSRLIESNPKALCKKKSQLINAFKHELKDKRINNIILLIQFLSACENYRFKELYNIREISIQIIKSLLNENNERLTSSLLDFLNDIFPELRRRDINNKSSEELIEGLENVFIMTKINFIKRKKGLQVDFNEYLENLKQNSLKEDEIYFYTKNKDATDIKFYELEREKTKDFFNQAAKISYDKILNKFSEILELEDIPLFMKTLIKLGQIKGYLSDFYFYPLNYIISKVEKDLEKNGYITLKQYNHLPLKLVKSSIKEVAKENEVTILIGKKKQTFYRLSKIKNKLSKIASREASINLEEYRKKLTPPSFLKLVKHLPKNYLTNFHKNTIWLTNIGKIKFEQELRNSKLIGYFDIKTVSEKINIPQPLLLEILNAYIDVRAGIWNKTKDRFYYSKYVKSKLEMIDQTSDPEEKSQKIKALANKLNIKIEKLHKELDKKINLIAQEIQKQDKISISNYVEKTGMTRDSFFDLIVSLDLTYLKKGDQLIFNPSKIENAKKKVKQFIKKEATTQDFISLGTYDISSTLIKDLINDLKTSGNVNGIFHTEEDGEIRFYTGQGIKNMMLEKTYMFSFHDLFYGKDLSNDEIETIKEIFMDLYDSGRLKGNFDEESLTFTTDEILFANEYNKTFHEFYTNINKYFAIFNSKFQYIKKVLTKKTTILPKEIKKVEKLIKTINKKSITWKNELEAFIIRKHEYLLNQQGISVSKFRKLLPEEREEREIKGFAEDDEVKELMEGFEIWDKLFDNLEKKYLNVLFYQKQFIKNPSNQKYQKLLNNLKIELNLL
ncbi:MAG: hypothetical protein EU547_01995 [Promethearchaeota archaeon]|nr:MAG: hypothetical protein EU547_01995 [Candidatus Lokiarchaeota archaeon]